MHRACSIERLPIPVEPLDALELYERDEHFALLESAGPPSELGRYSFLCGDPFWIFRSDGGACLAGPPGALAPVEGDPFDVLAALIRRFGDGASSWQPGMPPFVGGAVGYLGYEMLHQLEDVPRVTPSGPTVPDAYLLFCGTVLAHDRRDGQSWIFAQGLGESLREAELDAARRLDALRVRLASLLAGRSVPGAEPEDPARRERLTEAALLAAGLEPVISRGDYLAIVARARAHIAAGDVFEVCTTQRFDTRHDGSGLALYRALRTINRAPFSAFLRAPEIEILCTSPERFLRVDRDRECETRPIKGTRPRGRTSEEDRALRDELAASEKDRAENVMIVDLARNDLGRVCEIGSVRVPELQVVEAYPTTFQLVSTVRGKLRPGLGAIDAVRAAFPGGSMTGAPKVEAMKIIASLEPVPRGVYSGSIGYFDFDGACDLNIVIRTFVKQGRRLHFHVGGAVVADSVPEDEYQETLDKARGLVTALERARARDRAGRG